MNTNQIIERIKGVVMLKAPVYRTIAEDPAATMEAWAVFVVSTVIAGLSGFFSYGNATQIAAGNLTPSFTLLGGLGGIVVSLVVGAIAMYLSAWVLAFVAVRLGGKTNIDEMLRIVGYTRIFGIIGVLNLLSVVSVSLICLTGILSLVVAILGLVGFVIGVREAGEFTTTNAIITGVVAAIINFIIIAVVGGVLFGIFGLAAR